MHEPILIYSDCTRIEISNLPKGSQTSVQETQLVVPLQRNSAESISWEERDWNDKGCCNLYFLKAGSVMSFFMQSRDYYSIEGLLPTSFLAFSQIS